MGAAARGTGTTEREFSQELVCEPATKNPSSTKSSARHLLPSSPPPPWEMSFFDELWREAKATAGAAAQPQRLFVSMATKRPSSLDPAGAQGSRTEDDSGWDLVERSRAEPKPKQACRRRTRLEARGSAGYLVGGEVEKMSTTARCGPARGRHHPLASIRLADACPAAHIGASRCSIIGRRWRRRCRPTVERSGGPDSMSAPASDHGGSAARVKAGLGHASTDVAQWGCTRHCALPSLVLAGRAAAAIAPSPPPPPLAAAGPAPSAEVTNSCTASGLAPQPAVQARSDPLPVAAELPPPAAAELPPPPSSPVIAASAGADAGMVIGAAAPSAGLAEGMLDRTGLQGVDARQPTGVPSMPQKQSPTLWRWMQAMVTVTRLLTAHASAQCHRRQAVGALVARLGTAAVLVAMSPRPTASRCGPRQCPARSATICRMPPPRPSQCGLSCRWPLPCPPASSVQAPAGSPHWRKCVAQSSFDVILFRPALCYQAILPGVRLAWAQLHSAAYEWAILLGWALPAHHLRDCDDETPLKMAMQIGPAPPAPERLNFIERVPPTRVLCGLL